MINLSSSYFLIRKILKLFFYNPDMTRREIILGAVDGIEWIRNVKTSLKGDCWWRLEQLEILH